MSTTTGSSRTFDNVATAGPSPLGAWLTAAVRRIVARATTPPATRTRAQEAAEVRAWAERVRRADPRFADDLFAAADRHELQGS